MQKARQNHPIGPAAGAVDLGVSINTNKEEDTSTLAAVAHTTSGT